MSDYDSASDAVASSLGEGLIEEYEIAPNKRRVKRGAVQGQVQAAAMLEGLAARRAAGGIFNVAKTKDTSSQ